MKTLPCLLLATLLTLLMSVDLPAQESMVLSPRDSVSLRLDTAVISVNYGRPSMRGRKVMGQLVPWNKVWRTGANEATHLRTNFDMLLGGVPVPRGRYTIWTLPSTTGWKLIVNKQTGQWGTAYDERQDLARFDAKVEQLSAPVDTFTIALEATGPSSGVLKLKWEKTLVTAAFERSDKIRPLSPPDTAVLALGGKKVSIAYSRPYARGRAIWGTVVPMDSIWRTGANLATALRLEGDMVIGTTTIQKGSYTLYSIPAKGSLILIVSKKPGGSQPAYDPTMDLTRIPMKMEYVKQHIDPFRIWFEPQGRNAAVLHIGWTDRMYSVVISPR